MLQILPLDYEPFLEQETKFNIKQICRGMSSSSRISRDDVGYWKKLLKKKYSCARKKLNNFNVLLND